jgi:hypothetical protein
MPSNSAAKEPAPSFKVWSTGIIKPQPLPGQKKKG